MKKFVSIAFALILCVSLSTVAMAYVLIGGTLDSGVSGIPYYVSSSASTYSSLVTTAAADWKTASGSFVTMSKQSSAQNSVMDFYEENITIGDEALWIAWTYRENISDTGWGSASVYLNKPWYSRLGSTVFKASIAHEMGHVMGLDENNAVTNSIMCQQSEGRTTNIPKTDDVNGIKYLY